MYDGALLSRSKSNLTPGAITSIILSVLAAAIFLPSIRVSSLQSSFLAPATKITHQPPIMGEKRLGLAPDASPRFRANQLFFSYRILFGFGYKNAVLTDSRAMILTDAEYCVAMCGLFGGFYIYVQLVNMEKPPAVRIDLSRFVVVLVLREIAKESRIIH